MARRTNPERLIQKLIDHTFRGYIFAAKNRAYIMEMCNRVYNKTPEDRNEIPPLIRQAATLSRMCDGMSNELQRLHELLELLRQAKDKNLHIVIEHVDTFRHHECASSTDMKSNTSLLSDTLCQWHSADTGQRET
jgi:hypothetical protein